MGTSANEHLEQSSSKQLKQQKLYYNTSSFTANVSCHLNITNVYSLHLYQWNLALFFSHPILKA